MIDSIRSHIITKLKSAADKVDTDGDKAWTIENRLRKPTFKADTQLQRDNLMGVPARYGEVIARQPVVVDAGRRANAQLCVKDFTFDVRLWRGYEDADTYIESSQKDFDAVVEEVLYDTANIGAFEGANYWVISITDINILETALDNAADRIAHFMGFQITVRANEKQA